MSGFVRLVENLDPFELFGAQVRRPRLAIKSAYNGAFAAWDRKVESLQVHHWFGASDTATSAAVLAAAHETSRQKSADVVSRLKASLT